MLISLLVIFISIMSGLCNHPPKDIQVDQVTPTATTEMVVVIEAATPTAQAVSEVLPTKTKIPTIVIQVATSTPGPEPTATDIPTPEIIVVPIPEPTATIALPPVLPRAGG
jgi:hypothetical protein